MIIIKNEIHIDEPIITEDASPSQFARKRNVDESGKCMLILLMIFSRTITIAIFLSMH